MRSVAPNALLVNVADLPGDLLQASQLTIIMTAFRVLPESTEQPLEQFSIPLGPYNTSLLQTTVPSVNVHRAPPKIVYASVDEYAAPHSTPC